MKEAERYIELLDSLYKEAIGCDCVPPSNKLEFIGNHIFEFRTYSGDLDALFAKRMILVCKHILERTTFDFIRQSDENHIEYITMCNIPFLLNKIDWGTSIRGAWFDDSSVKIDYNNVEIEKGQFKFFMRALIDWAL